jgi:hypothetical protein
VKDTDPEREETDREQDNQGEHQEPDRAARDDLGRGEGRVPGPAGEGRVARPQFRVGRTKTACWRRGRIMWHPRVQARRCARVYTVETA